MDQSKRRVFLIVLDSVGIGEMPDAALYGDEGSNTMGSISKSTAFRVPNLIKMGLSNIDGLEPVFNSQCGEYGGVVARMSEQSKGKDTTIGHWEIAGIVSDKPLPVFPEGFPPELMNEFEKLAGRKILCNRPYSGTEVIKDFGQEHVRTGDLIVYTSADSVFQIAAHEDVISVEELYRYCETARELCRDDYAVGRVIARPFAGEYPYQRTKGRHDYSVMPPAKTMLDYLKEHEYSVLGVGKIHDIFAGCGITKSLRTQNNEDGIEKTLLCMDDDFEGLCFVNLVDFDMVYGHRNDVDGYARALTEFDKKLPQIMEKLREDDLLMITADHGCDPGTPSTDHSREYTPLIMYGKHLRKNCNLGTRESFADIGKTILEYFEIDNELSGQSFLKECLVES